MNAGSMKVLVIRAEQMRKLRTLTIVPFHGKLEAHLTRNFPDACNALGGKRVRELVELGTERAFGYGFHSEKAVCKYLSIMFAYHTGFDRDPELPWAQRIIGEPEDAQFEPRIERLMNEALAHQEQARGIHRDAS